MRWFCAMLVLAGVASAQQPLKFTGAACSPPPALHCPDKDCPTDRVINPGPVVVRSEAGRESHVHPESARRRIVRELAAPLFPYSGLCG